MKKLLILSLFFLSSAPFYRYQDLIKYLKRVPEFPQPDNNDYEDLLYTTFHKSLEPSWFERIWQRATRPDWCEYYFRDQLKKATKLREKEGLKNACVTNIQLDKTAYFIIWSDVHAALHSFAQSIIWLKKQQIINDKFKIIKDDYYFVLNGNMIDQGPYSLEVLSLAIQLLINNPDRVFYLRGKHESENHWHYYGLKRELVARAQHIGEPGEDIPLGRWISEFFNTLPVALYINETQNLKDVIRISPESRAESNFNDQQVASFLLTKHKDPVAHLSLEKSKKTPDKHVNIRAIIKEQSWQSGQRNKTGLNMLNQDYGSMAWAITSGPTLTKQKIFGFTYDAFALLHATIPLKFSTITLYNQSINDRSGFTQNENFYLFTGTKTNEDYPEKEITIGSSMSLISGVPAMGQRTQLGMQLKIFEQNIKGGIKGHHINLIVYNDNYTPFLARTNIKKLIEEDNVDLVLLPVGSPTLSSYLDYIKKNEVFVLFPISGGPQFRSKELGGLIHLRASYSDEIKAIINYLITEYGTRNFAFFYQNDAYGLEPLATAKKILKEHGIEKFIELPYARGSVNFETQVKELQQAQPDAIGLFSTAGATQELIRQLGVNNLANTKLFGLSFLGTPSFKNFAKKHGLEILFGAVVPNPHVSQLPIVKEYREVMDKSGYEYDVYSLEAYIATSVLIEILKNIKGPLTKDKIKKEFESIEHMEYKGLSLNFNPINRTLLSKVWIETKPTQDWIEFDLNKDN